MALILACGNQEDQPADAGGSPEADTDTDTDTDADTDADTDTDTAETDTGLDFGPPPEVRTMRAGCDAKKGVLRVEVNTLGRAYRAVLFQQETGASEPQHAEEHEMEIVDFDKWGFWSDVAVELQVGQDPWTPGSSTAFECADAWEQRLTWLIRLYDRDGTMSGCGILGHDDWGLLHDQYERDLEPSNPAELDSCFALP